MARPLPAALPAALAALALAGCAGVAGGEPRTAPKELFVEVAAVDSNPPRLVPFPFRAEDEEGMFCSIRSVARGAAEHDEKLATALGHFDPEGRPRLDRSAFPPGDPPALLVSLAELGERRDDGCYLGHSAYASRPGLGGRFVHHLRLLVINRRGATQTLAAGDLRAFAPGPPEAPLDALAFLDGAGAPVDQVEVPPGEARLVHAFFAADALPPALHVRWHLALGGERAVDLDARLVRRYVVPEGAVTALEDAVGRGRPLPRPRGDPRDPWREPYLEPLGAR